MIVMFVFLGLRIGVVVASLIPAAIILGILLMNVFAQTIDHFVIQSNVKMRLNRLKIKAA